MRLIYGAGNFGKALAEYFKKHGIEYGGFIESRAEAGKKIFGNKVFSAESLGNIDISDIEIDLAISNKYIRQIIKENLVVNYKVDRTRIYDYTDFIYKNNLTSEHDKYCNICGSFVREFTRVIDENEGISEPCICPVCGSIHRFRYQMMIINKHSKLFRENQAVRVLHFGAEDYLGNMIRNINPSNMYITADISPGAMVKMDMTNMSEIPNGFFDYIIANHVMEHIIDDKKAVEEMSRCLKDDGEIILSFPVYESLEETFEDRSIVLPEERLKFFGQEDHVRKYGMDYIKRYESYGLEVRTFKSQNELTDYERKQLGIIYGDKMMICKKKKSI